MKTQNLSSRPWAAFLLFGLLASGCHFDNELPEGIRATPPGEGPRILFDLDAKPLPEIPLPNDLATTLDPNTPTGRRLNLSVEAPTDLESEIRADANTLDGFSTYGPITVSFDAPLDVTDLWNRQNDRDLSNDAIFLINVDPDSPRYGEIAPLDVGSGNFPIVLKDTCRVFPNDYRCGESNMLFETVDEDTNNNGQLDPGEDTDFDSVLDRPNTFPGSNDTVDGLMSFYERETNTLLFRPVLPLDEQTTYAVVLTSRLTGVDPDPLDTLPAPPIQSPFAWIHHTRQTEALSPLPALLEPHGVTSDEIAFAWSFTTQTITLDLLELRRGLYGHGPLRELDAEYPPDITRLAAWREDDGDTPHLMRKETFIPVFELVATIAVGDSDRESIDALVASFDYLDYIVAGSFYTPYLLVDRDGEVSPGNVYYDTEVGGCRIRTEDGGSTPFAGELDRITGSDNVGEDDEIWDIDHVNGEVVACPNEVNWMCFIPDEQYRPVPGEPFPVAFYAHGYGSMRLESLGFAGNHAKFGLATCAIDAPAHGLLIPGDIENDPVLTSLLRQLDAERLPAIFTRGRARDLNNDGAVDSGGDYFTANSLHTRDILRQSALDYLAFIRVLRSFDGTRTWNLSSTGPDDAILEGIAGDFDGDGVLDLGGYDADYFMWGQSLGGILSAIIAAVEPAVTAAAPTSGGGGLTDVLTRTNLGGVVKAVWLPLLGPIIFTRPNPDDASKTDVFWHLVNLNDDGSLRIATLDADELAPGDTIAAYNLRNGEHDSVVVDAQRRSRLSVAADALRPTERQHKLGIASKEVRTLSGTEPLDLEVGDPFRIEIYAPEGALKRTIQTYEVEAAWQDLLFAPGSTLVSPMEGFGFKRQTPRLRRFISIAQTLVDPADPINYAKRYQDPLPFDDIEPNRSGIPHVLVSATVGDMSVPVNTGIAIARAAGYIPLDTIDPRYGMTPNEMLIDRFVLEAVPRFERFGADVGPKLFDPDNLDNDTDGLQAPSPAEPLRLSTTLSDGTLGGMRLPYMKVDGEHGFALPSPQKGFDIDTFMVNQISWYFVTRGRVLSDDPCLEDSSCEFIPPAP